MEPGVGPVDEMVVLERLRPSDIPVEIRTSNQQIMRRFEGHQQGQTKPDVAAFTESAAVKVSYILLRLSTPSRHNRAIRQTNSSLIGLPLVSGAPRGWLKVTGIRADDLA